MCGFVGVVMLGSSPRAVADEVMMGIAESLSHRGPDARGLYSDSRCILAHRRLSILDLSAAGVQPMSNEDGRVWLVDNGEIYNFRELRRQWGLDRKGHRFRSQTDTEVVLHLYEEKGIECLHELDGMYALAIWDRRSRTLHLARDPFGVKPLFYTQTRDAFWFASELKALLEVPGVEIRPSHRALHHYLSFNYVPGELTAFAGIFELRPGHRIVLRPQDDEPRRVRFHDFEYPVAASTRAADAVARSRQLLRQAVERQLVSDVPIGVMLSGGLDSSALTAMVAEIRGDADFNTYSLVFDEPSYDESRYARMVAEHVGTRHHEIRVTPDKVRDALPTCLSHIDEPYADGSAIPTLLLAEAAKRDVRVLLSGEGGDEVFTGYDTHAAYKVRRYYRMLPRALRRRLVQPIVGLLPLSDRKLSLSFKAGRFVHGAELAVAESHFYWREVLSEELKREILADSAPFEGFAPSARLFVEAFERCTAAEELSRLLYIDLSYHLPDDLMIKNDRMTMAHSLEARVPFTDRDLVTFLATVPADHKLRGLEKKRLLRRALCGLLPKPVLHKKKVGLEMPYAIWLRQELCEFTEALLSPTRVRQTGLFDARALSRLWREHQRREADHARALWGVINYLLWHELYVESRRFRAHRIRPLGTNPPWYRFGATATEDSGGLWKTREDSGGL